MAFVDSAVRVQVPATSANLGPGFDALGLALDLVDDAEARVVGSGLTVEVAGEGADVRRDESHLVVRAMRAGFERIGAQPPGLALSCTNRIPHSRGLGSSAAAIVAGLLLARELSGGVATLPDADVLGLASAVEGHPDNVAACLLGGLTIAWDDGSVHAVRLAVESSVRPVAFVPPFTASTEVARGLLPPTVPHADAAFTAGRSALLVAALTGETVALLPATEDRLHQNYRERAMPHSAGLVHTLRATGIAAVISGAGPAVLALTSDAEEADRAAALAPEGWQVRRLAVRPYGARVVTSAT
jgi:homoserine kinase